MVSMDASGVSFAAGVMVNAIGTFELLLEDVCSRRSHIESSGKENR